MGQQIELATFIDSQLKFTVIPFSEAWVKTNHVLTWAFDKGLFSLKKIIGRGESNENARKTIFGSSIPGKESDKNIRGEMDWDGSLFFSIKYNLCAACIARVNQKADRWHRWLEVSGRIMLRLSAGRSSF